MHQKIRNSSRMTIEKRSSKREAVQIQSALQAYRECFSYAAVLFYRCPSTRAESLPTDASNYFFANTCRTACCPRRQRC